LSLLYLDHYAISFSLSLLLQMYGGLFVDQHKMKAGTPPSFTWLQLGKIQGAATQVSNVLLV
jgi:hypothetical protein